MTDLTADYIKRPVRCNLIDGVDEMLIGFLFLALPLLAHVANVAPEGSVWQWRPLLLIINGVLLVLILVSRKLLKQLITFRRTGYVKYRDSKIKGMIGAIVGLAVATPVMVAIYRLWPPPQRERHLILISSLLWAAFYTYFFIYKTEMYRTYRYVVVLLMAIGPLAVYSIFGNVRDISTLSGAVMGACFLISGVITFWSYLRRTHPADAEIEDETK